MQPEVKWVAQTFTSVAADVSFKIQLIHWFSTSSDGGVNDDMFVLVLVDNNKEMWVLGLSSTCLCCQTWHEENRSYWMLLSFSDLTARCHCSFRTVMTVVQNQCRTRM